MIQNFILVGFGGALGAMMRHGVGLFFLRTVGSGFPWGTLTVNWVGSLCIGIIAGLLALMTSWSQELRLFAVVGILGGFTTFSAFSLDSLLLIERGQISSAAFYIAASVIGSLAATGIGLFLIRSLTA